jgi:hypothetical protein
MAATKSRRKKSTAEKLAEQDLKAQADEITRIIEHTCSLLDDMLLDGTKFDQATPVIDRMKAYLDRRGLVAEDPAWIVKMRRTVTAYLVRRSKERGEDAFSIP